MKKIGVLFGMENTFPGALVERINSMEIRGDLGGVCATSADWLRWRSRAGMR